LFRAGSGVLATRIRSKFAFALSVTTLSAAAVMATAAQADVVSLASNGFEVRHTVHVATSADKAYAVLVTPSRWWASDHTFSGNAANLVLDARAGGCWCENFPDGGSVQHLQVVYVSPGKILRMRGALGPFQSLAVDGVMTWTLKSAPNGTDITVTYALGGYVKDGFDMLSKAADRVITEQADHLKRLIDG
jgi:Polyketide cyclase / dehydrase and lipid transport